MSKKTVPLFIWIMILFGSNTCFGLGSLLQASSETRLDGYPILLVPKSYRYIYLTQYFERDIFDKPSSRDTYTDGYRYFPFVLNFDANVSIKIRSLTDGSQYLSYFEGEVEQGVHYFSLSYSSVNKLLGSEQEFEVRLDVDVVGENAKLQDSSVWQGSLAASYRGEMLGNIIQHDIFISTGNIVLRREDIDIPHHGPGLNFIRSYNGHSIENSLDSVMGRGWAHNHDIKISIHKTGTQMTRKNIPQWIENSLNKVKPIATLPEEYLAPSFISITNGGSFQLLEGKWVAQRSFHGRIKTLPQNEGEFVYISKDATKYFFDPIDLSIKRPSILKKDLRFKANKKDITIIDDAHNEKTLSPMLAFSGPPPLNLRKIVDKNGISLEYDYKESQFNKVLSEIRDSIGRKFTFSYNIPFEKMNSVSSSSIPLRLQKVSGPDNLLLEFTYDKLYFEQIKFKRGSFNERYEYTQLLGSKAETGNQHYITERSINKLTDGRNHVTRFFLNNPEKVSFLAKYLPHIPLNKTVAKTRYPDMNVAHISYGPQPNERNISTLKGYKTHYVLNRFGNPLKVSLPDGSVEENTWSVDVGLNDTVLLRKKTNEGVTDYEYDRMGNVTKTIYPNGQTKNTRWDLHISEPLEITYANGAKELYRYSTLGNLMEHLDGNYKTTYEYDELGRKVLETTDDAVERYTYGSNGYLASYAYGGEVQFTYQYDLRGRLTKKVSASGVTEEYSYDNLDRLTQIKRASKVVKANKYDVKGNKIYEKDDAGEEIFFTYNERDLVSKARYGSGEVSYFRYDPDANLIMTVDTNGDIRIKEYGENDQQITKSGFVSWDTKPIY